MSAFLPPDISCLLAASASADREEAWAAFAANHNRLLLHVCHSLGGDHDAVMDRYAYVLEQLRRDDFRRLRSYVVDGRSKFTTWLVVVARRLCLDHQRQVYGRNRSAAGAGPAEQEARANRRRLVDLVGEQLDPEELEDRGSAPADAVVRTTELNEALEASVARLKARDRLLLRLRFDDGLSAREIAQIMDFPSPFHVYRRLQEVLGELRGSLATRGVLDPVP
ncbi:MAG: sigma-70 family RNA polymerase sigma factor [Gemmatimonadetes bacterium]|nr:sigma-70 family RNA polymerase sigma factor [Gemmatimonadota bacterium]